MSLALAVMLLAAPSIDDADPSPIGAASVGAVSIVGVSIGGASDADLVRRGGPAPAPVLRVADDALVADPFRELPQDAPPAPQLPPPPPIAIEQDAIEQDEIVVTGRAQVDRDPLVGINAPSFAATQKIDDAIVGPLAAGYVKALPGPVRSGIHNFLSNLHEPVIFLNYLLQAKPGKAAETLGRFAINSTIGAAGLFDVAKRRPFRLPFRPNGFANTFGFYGVKPGPFLFLPIVGATTARDLVGLVLDRLVLPVAVGAPFGKPAYAIPTGILHTLDRRVEFEPHLRRTQAAPDPYVARRDLYLTARQAEIDRLHHRPVADDPLRDSPVR